MPLNTATPNSAINPTPAEILKGIPRSKSATTPPMADNGTAVKISMVCLDRPKAEIKKSKDQYHSCRNGDCKPAFCFL